MPETCATFDEARSGGAQFGASTLKEQQDEHRDPDQHMEQVQPGEDEVVEAEVVLGGDVALGHLGGVRRP